MSRSPRKAFRAVLETASKGPRFLFARVPVDLKKAWPSWRNRRVVGEINGFAFRTTLFPSAKGSVHVLLVNKRMQAAARAGPGAQVHIWLEPDMAEPVSQVPPELARVLKSERQLRRWFDALSPSMRKGISAFVDQAKGAETRTTRAEKMAESLMLAMEGEQVPPPILRSAFQRQPLAQEGWHAMTATKRRNHLLGIFYVQTAEGRKRRVARTIEECLRIAQRKNRNV